MLYENALMTLSLKDHVMSGEHWFEYHGKHLTPSYHLYNLTHLNERMVELAVAFEWLKGESWSQGLEVGNVLGHYKQMTHDVIDLYEEASWYQVRQRIINVDILHLHVPEKFQWVCSLSTVEHTADPVKAIKVLADFVKPGGKLLVTFPTGVRQELDALIMRPEEINSLFTKTCTIVREDNDHGGWAPSSDISVVPYGPWANSVFIGEWECSK
jgi:SAM-dependent methyltransferase